MREANRPPDNDALPLTEAAEDDQETFALNPQQTNDPPGPLPLDIGTNGSSGPHEATTKKDGILSPLRYPGSKRRLAKYVRRALELNGLYPDLLVEPFAGGASVALHLLNAGLVKKIGLMDLDPLVSAFWQTVFFDADWLVDQIENVNITLERWHEFKATIPDRRRERALACLFLNRTSFSGILAPSAGPIGGQQQTSAYGLDCRFPRQTLVDRVRQAEALRDNVAFVWNTNWKEGVLRVKRRQRKGTLSTNTLYYLDPPFFEKADRLYNHFFVAEQHQELRDFVLHLEDSYILSYDSVDKVNELYDGARLGPTHVEVLYSASGNGGRRATREAIITNLETVPDTDLRNQGNGTGPA